MNGPNYQTSEFFGNMPNGGEKNHLMEYIQSMSQETVSHLSQPDREVAQAMERNLYGILGALPSDQFGVTITTTRESLGRLLTSAMLTGYFLHSAQQRMAVEKSLQASDAGDEQQ
ncbi:DUF760 domain-containing protein [Geitlerinema sp. PCC 9228]|jgi:hypothetical protein|uniref:DUF760 domain-containing protein n=1 Tax=Geitlerinema sp. PCC 9228 TaxID=111611 RepID=UPI0008F9BF0D|nr:DUF760 domain-containing protein [Geitlerinema sp. PCC 9228]